MRIKEVREEKGLTQRKLAKMINVSQAAIANWERGYRKVSLENLYKIASALKVSIYELLNETEGEPMTAKNVIKAPFQFIKEGVRGGLAFILRHCFDCMVIYPKVKKNAK